MLTGCEERDRIDAELVRTAATSDPFAAAVRATRMPMLITDPSEPDNPIVFANNAFCRLTGYSSDEILGHNCRFLQGPDTDGRDVARVREAIETKTSIELDLLNYRKDGSTFWNRLLVSPVFGPDGELTYFFASQFDVTADRERLAQLRCDRDELEADAARRTAELQASEERLRFALEAGQLGSWSISLETGDLIASDRCKMICGRDPCDPLSFDELRASIHPDDRAAQDEAMERAIASRSLLDIEYRVITPAGEERWVQIRGKAHYRADRTPILITGTSHDITERRAVQSQHALLTRELHHRMKNTLASLQAIVSQTMRRATSLHDASETLNARIQAMSAANALLIAENFGSVSMRDLVARSLAPFGVEDTERFHLSGDDVRLPPQVIVAYALVLHELATNSTKYGALSVAEGVIIVEWSIQGDKGHPLLHLLWREQGGPPVEAPLNTSFGTQLIKRVLASETGGHAEIHYHPAGVIFNAVSPLANTKADA